jgi:hypothetical protein
MFQGQAPILVEMFQGQAPIFVGQTTRCYLTHPIFLFELRLSFNFLIKHDVSDADSASVFRQQTSSDRVLPIATM